MCSLYHPDKHQGLANKQVTLNFKSVMKIYYFLLWCNVAAALLLSCALCVWRVCWAFVVSLPFWSLNNIMSYYLSALVSNTYLFKPTFFKIGAAPSLISLLPLRCPWISLQLVILPYLVCQHLALSMISCPFFLLMLYIGFNFNLSLLIRWVCRVSIVVLYGVFKWMYWTELVIYLCKKETEAWWWMLICNAERV